MKIRIKKLPKAKHGGFMGLPFAGSLPVAPTGTIKSNTTNLDESFNDSVKGIDRDKANVEAEKGELLFKFEAGGIFKINGNKHSKGGTPLKVDEGDFIFSDDKDLAITKQEAEQFDLNISNKKRLNTPAKILANEIDIKAYNKFLYTLQDPKADPISKATAQLMLNKYAERIGQLAFLQEGKKQFPQGMPEFAEGTAPVHDDQLVHEVDKAPMYMKRGGTYLPKAQPGLYAKPQNVFNDDWMGLLQDNPNAVLSDQATKDINQQILSPQHSRGNGKYGDSDWNMKDFESRHPDYINQYGTFNPAKDTLRFQNWYNEKSQRLYGTDYFGGAGFRAKDGKFGEYTYNAPSLLGRPRMTAPIEPHKWPVGDWKRPDIAPLKPTASVVNNGREVPFQGFNIGMNAQEVLSGIMPFMGALATPTYYDMLTQKHSPDLRLDRVDNTQEVNNIQSQGSLAQREMFANMPGSIAALASTGTQAQVAQGLGNSYANVRQQNTQIGNQEAMVNFETDQKDNLFNLQNVHQTYNNNQLARQRRNEMLTNGAIDSTNNFLAIQNNLDAINQQATAAVLPYLSLEDGVDANGNPIKVQVPPVTFGRNRIPIPTGFGSLNSVTSNNNNMQAYNDIVSSLKEAMASGDPRAKAYAANVMANLYNPNSKGNTRYEELMSGMLRGMYQPFVNPYVR